MQLEPLGRWPSILWFGVIFRWALTEPKLAKKTKHTKRVTGILLIAGRQSPLQLDQMENQMERTSGRIVANVFQIPTTVPTKFQKGRSDCASGDRGFTSCIQTWRTIGALWCVVRVLLRLATRLNQEDPPSLLTTCHFMIGPGGCVQKKGVSYNFPGFAHHHASPKSMLAPTRVRWNPICM